MRGPAAATFGHGVLPVVLDGAAHHEQIALAEEERERVAATARSQQERPGRPDADDGDERIDLGVAHAIAVPGHAVRPAPVVVAADRVELPAVVARQRPADLLQQREWARAFLRVHHQTNRGSWTSRSYMGTVRWRHGNRATISAKTWSEPSSHRGRWSSQLVSSSASRRTPCNDGSNPGSPAANRLACHSTVSSRTASSRGLVSQRSVPVRIRQPVAPVRTPVPRTCVRALPRPGGPARGFFGPCLPCGDAGAGGDRPRRCPGSPPGPLPRPPGRDGPPGHRGRARPLRRRGHDGDPAAAPLGAPGALAAPAPLRAGGARARTWPVAT